MFYFILTVFCAVFIVGYIFFAAASEHEGEPPAMLDGEELLAEHADAA